MPIDLEKHIDRPDNLTERESERQKQGQIGRHSNRGTQSEIHKIPDIHPKFQIGREYTRETKMQGKKVSHEVGDP